MPDENIQADEDEVGRTVNRNFAIPLDDAEWLRTTAFLRKTSQARLVRRAIRDLRARLEADDA
jgi:hypothetical protein